MDKAEIRLRLIEAAAKQPSIAHGQMGWARATAAEFSKRDRL